jgi:hypothetical protein
MYFFLPDMVASTSPACHPPTLPPSLPPSLPPWVGGEGRCETTLVVGRPDGAHLGQRLHFQKCPDLWDNLPTCLPPSLIP